MNIQKRKPFQVNCSELIADFKIKDIKDAKEIIDLLIKEYDIKAYLTINVNRKHYLKDYYDDWRNYFTLKYEDFSENLYLEDNNIKNKDLELIDLDNIEIVLKKDKSFVRLVYGDNEYDPNLGWYFEADQHVDKRAFPFLEWAEKNYNAEICSYDGGWTSYFEEFKEDKKRFKLERG